MTTQDLINTLKQGKPMTAPLMREIVRELEEKRFLIGELARIKRYYDMPNRVLKVSSDALAALVGEEGK